MIYRYDIFGGYVSSRGVSTYALFALYDIDSLSVALYFEAADNIVLIVSCSCEEYIRYINLFLLSTIWLASAVQLVRKYLEPPPPPLSGGYIRLANLIKSRFDVLYMTYKRCA